MPEIAARSPQRDPAALVAPRTGFLRNTWYVAMWSEDLPAGTPKPRTICDEPIVFFRREDGGVAALADLCPHRFAPLSMGKILPGDRIMCPYHGLEFGTDGACLRNPHGNGTIPSGARVRSFPVVEKHSMLWIWMGFAAPRPELIPDYSCFDRADPLHVSKRDYLRMEANYELITDNLLDLSHTTYVHEGILGSQETVAAEVTVEQEGNSIIVRRSATETPALGMFKPLLPAPMERGQKWNSIRWDVPGCLMVDVGVCETGAAPETGTGFFGAHILTPETDRTTHYHFAAVRWNVLTSGDEVNAQIRDHLTRTRRFAFEEQDAPVIEAQQRAMDRARGPLRPVMLSIDAGPVRYRRVLERLMREDAEAELRGAAAE